MMRDSNGRFVKGHKLGMTGKHHSKETIQKIIQSNKGRHLSIKHKKKLSLARIGNQPWNKGKKIQGTPRTQEWKRKIGNANKGKIIPEWQKEILRQSRLRQIFPKKDTKPERLLQDALKTENIKFQTHVPLFGQPDIFIQPNLCIFVDGDYWHSLPKQIERDVLVTETLEKQGYRVIRIWEHEVYNNLKHIMVRFQ